MKADKKSILKIISVFISMIVGAGFASGQELIQFFISYGKKGLLGIIVSAFIFAFVGYCVMCISLEKKYASNNEFMRGVFGNVFGSLLEFIIGFLFLTFYVSMISAFGASVNQIFSVPFSIASIFVSILCFIVLSNDLDGVLKINSILSPIMFFGCIITGIFIIMAQNTEVFANNSLFLGNIKNSWFLSSIIYASYNIVTSISILSSMTNTIENKKNAFWGALISGVCLAVLGLCLSIPLFNDFEYAKAFEMPILALIGKYDYVMEFIYLIVLLIAIFSTAIGNGFAFISFLHNTLNIKKIYVTLFLFIFGFVTSHLGFSIIVGKIYPLFGIIGFIEIISISFIFFKSKSKNK